MKSWASLMAQMVRKLPALQATLIQSMGWKDLLWKEMATYSSILAWRIPWTEEPGGLQGVAKSWTQLSDQHFDIVAMGKSETILLKCLTQSQ